MTKNVHERKPTSYGQKRIAALLFLFFLALVFWSAAAMQANFFDSLGTLQKFSEENFLLAGLTFFVLSVLSALISPFSSVPLIPIAIALFGNLLTFCLLTAGWFLGSVISYSIGYSFGHKFFRILFPLKRIEYYKRQFSAHSQFMFVLLFRLAVPAEITGYTLGIIRYSFWKYLLTVFISELPFAVISVYSGWAILENNFIQFVLLLSLGLLLIAALSYFFHKKIGE